MVFLYMCVCVLVLLSVCLLLHCVAFFFCFCCILFSLLHHVSYFIVLYVWFGLVWFGLVWFGLVWFGLVWLVVFVGVCVCVFYPNFLLHHPATRRCHRLASVAPLHGGGRGFAAAGFPAAGGGGPPEPL